MTLSSGKGTRNKDAKAGGARPKRAKGRDSQNALSAERVWGTRLAGIKKKVMSSRRTALKTAFGLGDLWKELQQPHEGGGSRSLPALPRGHLIAFLASECRIPRREVIRHIRLAETFSEEQRKLLIQNGVEPNVALDLAAKKPDVRAVALKMIAEERCLAARDLKALCRDMKLGRAVLDGGLDQTRQSALLKAALAGRRAETNGWLQDLKACGEAFLSFAESEPEYRRDDEIMPELDALAGQAADLRARLPRIAGNDFLDLVGRRPGRTEVGGWQALDWALARIARRDVCMDLCDWPSGRDSLHVDFDLVWEIAWPFGYTKDDSPSQLRRQLRTEGRIPFEDGPSDEALRAISPRDFTVLEICAGAGSQAYGLEAAGFHHAGLVELDPAAAATLRRNRSEWPVFEGDLRLLDLSRFQDIDLLAGGVPCQFFSSLGKRGGKHDGRNLLGEALRLVKLLRPRAVMLENVPGLGHRNNFTYRLELLSRLRNLGYDAEWRTLDGLSFGLPQKRKRYVLVGFRPGMMHRFEWPLGIGIEAPTVGEALRELMGANGWPHVDDWVARANDQCPTILGASETKTGIDLAAAAGRKVWEKLGVNPFHFAQAAPDRDAPPPSDGFRPQLTMEMIARLQGLPDGWHLEGSAIERYRQIANAFPKRMAQALGLSIMRAFTGAAIDFERALTAPVRRPRRYEFNKLNTMQRQGEDPGAQLL